MLRRFCVLILAISPGAAMAASKEIQELQRDVAQLQDMVRTLQRAQDEKFAALQVLVQQSVNAANEATRSVAVIQSGFQQNLQQQQEKVVTPVVGLNARMDGIANDLRTLSQAVSDLTGLMSKLQTQLGDLNNAVRVMQAPAAPPPGSGPGSGSVPSSGGGAPDAPTMSATALYENARRDYMGGKYDLAAAEFADYLKYYGNTDMAPNAQFYIALIHQGQGDNEAALREFDIVLEKYPDNNKTPDAMYYKGMTLLKLNRRTDAAKEFEELIKRFPKNDFAPKACDQRKALGLNCGSPRAAAPPKGVSKRKK